MEYKDAPPDNADFGALDLALCLVDVCDALAEVELCVLLCCDALNLYQGGVRAGVALRPLVAQHTPFAVQSAQQKSASTSKSLSPHPALHRSNLLPIHARGPSGGRDVVSHLVEPILCVLLRGLGGTRS